MRALLCAITLLLLAGYSFGQKIPHIYQIRADTVRIYNTCDTAELVLENRTKDTLGFLFNKGKGRTEFQRLNLQRIGASQLAIQGQDTVDLNFSSYGDTRYDLLSTNFVKITPGDSLTFSQWPNRKVVGYDAYNSPDMPAISNQANPGATGKLYYNGLVVRDEDSGFDLAVNWNGELNGPNGAFLRTKDDTKSAWSKWRELLFKDYADTTYAPKDSETLQSVTSRGNSTNQNIMFAGTPASSAGLSWNFNSDVWRIFVESPQDTPAGDMIFESADNDQEGWIFRSKDGTTPKQVLNIQPEGTFTFLGNNILHAGNHVAGSAFTPTLTGANVLSTITTNASGHVTALTTRALTAADIGAAPATASGNYIQNQTAADQSSSGFRISGIGRSNSQFQIVKDGSNTAASAFQLYNAASTRGANIQLDANTNPGLNFWVHDGTTWQNRLALEADGKVGIGTADPILGVHIKNSTGGIILEANKPFATTSGGLFEAYNSGTPSAANQRLGGITMGALTNGTELRPSSQIDVLTAAAWSNDTSQSSYMRFMTTAIGAKQPAERMRIGADGTITMFNIPALGTAGTNFLTSNGGVISSRTAAQVLADLGAAPASTSGNYIQNQIGAVQSGNGWISGTMRAGAMQVPAAIGTENFSLMNASNVLRWVIRSINTESGSNAGYDLVFNRRADDGSNLADVLTMQRATGNVGIGTINPQFKLSVADASSTAFAVQNTAGISASSGAYVRLYQSGTPTAADQQLAGILGGTNSAGTTLRTGATININSEAAWTDGSSHPTYIRFNTTPAGFTALSERMRIAANGDVSIGTASGGNRLTVGDTAVILTSDINTYAQRISQNGGTLGVGGGSAGSYIQSFNSLPLFINAAGNNSILNANGGNVGINTSVPAYKLDVYTNSDVYAASFGDAANSNLRIAGTAGGATGYGLIQTFTGGTTAGGILSLQRSGGNVGIGTAAPNTTLHVNGSFRANGIADLGNTSMIRGSATGVANYAYMRFTNSNGDRLGYVGDGANTTNDVFLAADSGNVRLTPQRGTGGSLIVQTSSMDYNGGQAYLNNSTSNLLLFSTPGADEPTFSARSKGTKITLYPGIGASSVDYALGIDTSHMWSSIPYNNTTVGFKWYGGTTQIARLDGTGNLTLSGQVQATSFFQSSLRSLKKDIQPFTASALKIFEKVQVRTFKFKADASGKTNIGFIADEVPDEMATPKRNGVDQASTVALLVKAVQELTEQNKALQEKISQLEAKMKDK